MRGLGGGQEGRGVEKSQWVYIDDVVGGLSKDVSGGSDKWAVFHWLGEWGRE